MAAARGEGKLQALKLKDKKVGRHSDGRGLYLVVRPDSRAWVFRYRDRATQKLRDMGLGSLADVSLADARLKRDELRKLLSKGDDPIAQKEAAKAAANLARAADAAKRMTFAQCCSLYVDAHAPGWRNAKHAGQWRSTLTNEAALLSPLAVRDVSTELVLSVLQPIWIAKNETATRLRQRIEAVLDWAKVRKYRSGENPARWRGHLDKLLPKPSKVRKVEHHAAMPYVDMPAFLADLRAVAGLSARLLELLILTACRVGEAAAAEWSEFDLAARTWTVPDARMKAGKEHRVALSPAAVALLEALPKSGRYVFPGIGKRHPHMNPESARKLLQVDMGRTALTAHGFRSTFRDWAAERTSFADDVVESALAHVVKNKTEAAYKRTDLFAKRAKLMQAWATFLTSKPASANNVTPIQKLPGSLAG